MDDIFLFGNDDHNNSQYDNPHHPGVVLPGQVIQRNPRLNSQRVPQRHAERISRLRSLGFQAFQQRSVAHLGDRIPSHPYLQSPWMVGGWASIGELIHSTVREVIQSQTNTLSRDLRSATYHSRHSLWAEGSGLRELDDHLFDDDSFDDYSYLEDNWDHSYDGYDEAISASMEQETRQRRMGSDIAFMVLESSQSTRQIVGAGFECFICSTTIKVGGETIIPDNCGHEYCKNCARKWYAQSKECPLCRQRIHGYETDTCSIFCRRRCRRRFKRRCKQRCRQDIQLLSKLPEELSMWHPEKE